MDNRLTLSLSIPEEIKVADLRASLDSFESMLTTTVEATVRIRGKRLILSTIEKERF
jgi:hypothetical protein